MSLIVLIIEKKSIKKSIKGIFTLFIFMLTWVPINVICLFKRNQQWDQTEHSRSIDIDSLNENFKNQTKSLGGQSTIELRNDLSYVYQNGKTEGQNGVCVRYSKTTSSGQELQSFPAFSFGPEYKKNIDYKPAGQKDYSVFYKDKKVSCDVVYQAQALNVCCFYYKGQDPRSN